MLLFTIIYSSLTTLYFVARVHMQRQQRFDALKLQYHREMNERRDAHRRAPKGFKRWYKKHIKLQGDD